MIAAMERVIDLDLLQDRSVLPILLHDKTTGQNIIWATDTYETYGEGYSAKEPFTAVLVTGKNSSIIQPRIAKAISDQADRTKKHAEVFTPAWICNMMVNHCDEVWFGRKNVFNTSEDKHWTPSEAPIEFPRKKRWQRYVDSRRLEITCGEAPYLVSRYDASTGELIPFTHRIGILDRKLRVVNENAENEAEWLKFAFRALESVYGFEYQGDNLLIARVNVLMTFMDAVQERLQREATDLEMKRAAEIISWNIWQMDGLKGTVPFGSLQEANTQLSIWDLLGEMILAPEENKRPECQIYDWRGQGKLKYNDRKTRKGKEMKFDFVIGNPPYQDETIGDNKGYAPPVYHKFLDSAYQVGNAIEMVHPARFLYNAGSTPKVWNEKMLNDPHLCVKYFEANSKNVFANAEITGGVAITYYDHSKDFGAIEVFTSHAELNEILRKVKGKDDFSPMSDIVITRTAYRITEKLHLDYPNAAEKLSKGHMYDMSTNIFKLLPFVFHDLKPEDGHDYIQMFGRDESGRCYKFIRRDYVNTVKNLDKYKIFISKADGASGTIGKPIPARIIGKLEIAGKGVGATESFLSIGSFETSEEVQNAAKYVQSRFVRVLLGIMKTTQDITPDKWKCVPLQDFTPSSDIDWSVSVAEIDRQLYKKYNLSEEGIAFIETHVKEMA